LTLVRRLIILLRRWWALHPGRKIFDKRCKNIKNTSCYSVRWGEVGPWEKEARQWCWNSSLIVCELRMKLLAVSWGCLREFSSLFFLAHFLEEVWMLREHSGVHGFGGRARVWECAIKMEVRPWS
jgi:hypothetical protein